MWEPLPPGIAGPPSRVATRSPSTGITISTPMKAGDPRLYRQPQYQQKLAGLVQPPQTPGEDNNFSPLGGDGGAGGGGGGGGGANPGKIRAVADELFKLDESPYWMMQAGLNNQRQQAAAYNPDFAGMESTFNTGLQGREQARAADVAQRLQALAGFGGQLASAQGNAMQGALGDLAAQGVDPSQYISQANQIAGERTAGLANQGQYMGQLNASAANAAAGYGNAAGLIRQGGEATLANNRGVLNNQLDQQAAQIQMQAAKDRLANNQARREFMLRYGVT